MVPLFERHLFFVLARTVIVAGSLGLAMLTGCGGGGGVTAPPVNLTVSIPAGTVILPQDGTAATLPVTVVAPTESVTLAVTGLPAGVSQSYKASESNPSGQLTLAASATTPAGTYTPVVTVGSSGHSATTTITMVVAVVAKVGNSVDTTLGINESSGSSWRLHSRWPSGREISLARVSRRPIVKTR